MAFRLLAAVALFVAPSFAQDASTLGGGGGGGLPLTVDLGYAVYKGVAGGSTGLNTWKGYGHAVQLPLSNPHALTSW